MKPGSIDNKKKIRNFWVRTAVFAVLAAAVLAYTAYVLTPKYDYGICSMMNLYQQPADSIDVLALGTSQTYGGLNTNILWKEYGIAAYNLATAEQAYWVGYYYLIEALKTQHPKLLLLDTKASSYPNDTNRHGRVILGTYGILSLPERAAAIRECTGGEHVLSYLAAFPEIHSNYSELSADSFSIPPTNGGRGNTWKGYIEQDETEKHERPSLVWTSTKMAVNEHEMEYFRKILELCREKQIPVMLVSYPYPDYANDHMYVNGLFKAAEEYGVSGINYNHPDLRFGLRYSSDFADWQHLNLKGSANFSRKLASDILSLYDIPDRRGDDDYASYEECAARWFEQYPEYAAEEDTADIRHS
ncbi:MAG: hypothetical protein IJJ17_04150 [Parasporobacterium sp.]|nr:hypothetical protein [Parasporobacterium sp.]